MKNYGIKMSDTIKDRVLDVMPQPKVTKILKAQLETLLSSDDYDEIDDALNELIVVATQIGYDAGFQTALSLTQGKPDLTIVIDEE